MTVELADLDLGFELTTGDIDPREGEIDGVAGGCNHHGPAVKDADAPYGEADPAEPLQCGLRWAREDQLAQDVPALRPLHGEVVSLVGSRGGPHFKTQLLGLLAH